MYGYSEWGRDAFAEVVAVEEVGEDGAEYASQHGEGNDRDTYFCDFLEEPVLLEEGGGYADKDADEPVIEGFPVGETVDRVREESDDYGRERSAEHGSDNCAYAV